jgi:hypothetical protein
MISKNKKNQAIILHARHAFLPVCLCANALSKEKGYVDDSLGEALKQRIRFYQNIASSIHVING